MTLQDSASPNVFKFFVCIYLHCSNLHLAFTNEKRWINHSDRKTRPFGELRNVEVLFSDNQLWPQRICCATNQKIYFLTTDLRVIMGICCRQATKHSFLITQALVTCFWKLAGQNTSSLAEIMWRRGGLMVSELVPGSSGLGLSPGQEHCVVFLGKTLNSNSASLHPGV